jgi:conjugal transfer ATP-binding protein TraC
MTSYHGAGHDAGSKRLRRSVERDSYSDFCRSPPGSRKSRRSSAIDDGWGYAWELCPTAYMFAHVHEALLGLLNVNFPKARSSSSRASPTR